MFKIEEVMKIPLFVGSCLFVSGTVLFITCRAAKSVEMLIIGRLLVGLAAGIATSTAPMYLSELAPLHLRGSMATCMELGVTFGLLIAQTFSLEEVLGTEQFWHYCLCISTLLVVICMIFHPLFPESPKYLYIVAGKMEEAESVLKEIRGSHKTNIIKDEIRLMANEINERTEKRNIWSIIRDPMFLLPIILVCCLQGGQQLSGVNAVFFYSVSIFESAGLSSANAKWANLGTGAISFITVCLGPTIMAKINRRPVILSSCILSGFFLICLICIVKFIEFADWLSYISIVAVIAYIFSFEMGLGPIPYFMATELFESAPRPAAMALGSLSSWIGNFTVGMTFPILQLSWGAYVFLPYIFICFALATLLFYYLPETRGMNSSDVAILVSKGFRSKPFEKATE